MMKVYVVLYQGKACYDAPDIFEGVYATLEQAEESLCNWSEKDCKELFEIEEHEINGDEL